jgi:hypothetical protein
VVRSFRTAWRRLFNPSLDAVRRLGRWYGASPWQALAMAFCFALAGYAAVRLLAGRTLAVALWFVGGALLHDLVLVPLYSAADLAVRSHAPHAVPVVNHLRVPVVLSGLLFLVWFPLILRRPPSYSGASGLSDDVYLGRWLVITAVLFACSVLVYAVRWTAHRQSSRRS